MVIECLYFGTIWDNLFRKTGQNQRREGEWFGSKSRIDGDKIGIDLMDEKIVKLFTSRNKISLKKRKHGKLRKKWNEKS